MIGYKPTGEVATNHCGVHPSHIYMMPNLWLVLGVEVQSGNQRHSTYSSLGLAIKQFIVLVLENLPINDDGLSFGQAAVARVFRTKQTNVNTHTQASLIEEKA